MAAEELPTEEEAALDPGTALRLAAAAAWHTVQRQWVQGFPTVLVLLEAVEDAAPDLVHYWHLAKLRLGLQAKVIMNMLRKGKSDAKIYAAIDMYFPEHKSPPHPKAQTAHYLKLVQAAQENFRDLVLGLLSDQRQRKTYVQRHLENDYGETFQKVVEHLFYDYLWQLESTLPQPHFQQVLKGAYIQDPSRSSPDPSILSRYLTDMGYQITGPAAHPNSHNQSQTSIQSEDQQQQPGTPDSGKQQVNACKGRRKGCCPPHEQEQSSHEPRAGLQLSGSQETGEPDDIVLDSSGEGENSPFKEPWSLHLEESLAEMLVFPRPSPRVP